MFHAREHKFTALEHMFTARKHKFSALKHKIVGTAEKNAKASKQKNKRAVVMSGPLGLLIATIGDSFFFFNTIGM